MGFGTQPAVAQKRSALARRIRRWCGEDAYELFKVTGEVPPLPDPLEAQRASNRQYYARHRTAIASRRQANGKTERDRSRQRDRYRANLEFSREQNRAKYRKNLERNRASKRVSALRRYHRVHRGEDAEAREYRELVLVGDPCAYCGSSLEHVCDHIDPEAGGKFWNLTASCNTCNLLKGRRSLLEFLL